MRKRNCLMASLATSIALPVAFPGYSLVFAQEMALEEIVVTSRMRDESIYEIPVSVSAYSQDTLIQAGIQNAQELSGLAPGLEFRQTDFAGRDGPDIRIRGMIQQAQSPSTQIGALFWDGSYVGAGGGFLPLVGLERVEIIRGPQTAYFGRNTFAGAINYIPRRPGDEWEGRASLSYSPTDTAEYIANGGITGPITDKVGMSLWAQYQRDGGDFEFGDGEPFAQFEDTSINGMLTYDATEDLSFRLTGYYVRADDTSTGVSVPFTTPAGECDKVYRGFYENIVTRELTPFERDLSQLDFGTFCGELPDGSNLTTPSTRFPTTDDVSQSEFDALFALNPLSEDYDIIPKPDGGLGGWGRTYRIQLHGDYNFGDHTVSFITSRADTGTAVRRDRNFGNPPSIRSSGDEIAVRELYYEVRVASPQAQRLRYLAGVSVYNQHFNNFSDPGRSLRLDRQRNETDSIFGSIDYDIRDDLTLSVEGRYTDESSLVREQGSVTDDTPCGFSVCDQENSFDAFLPRVILTWTPFDGASTYVSWSKSQLLGLPTQARSISEVAPDLISPEEAEATGDFTPEQTATQYEFGWKQQWDRASMAFAAFHTEWENQVIAAVIFLPGNAGTSSFRAPGTSEYTGFELEATGQITDWFSLSGQVAYVDAVVTDFAARGSFESTVLGSGSLAVESDGNPVRYQPEWTGSISPVFTGQWGGRDWFIRADYIYTGEHYVDYSQFNQNRAREQVNLRAGIDLFDGSMIELFGTNIFNDDRFPLGAGTTNGSGGRKAFSAPVIPFEWGIRLSAEF